MIYISHRGNLNGIIHERENSLDYIQECLDAGYECEIDLRMKDGVPHLGHDTPDHPVSAEWLLHRATKLWIHVKEYEALVWLMQHLPNSKFFCHEGDRYTLTSNGWIWSHDMDNKMTEQCIIPLLSKDSVQSYSRSGFGAVCSDYIVDCVEKWG